MQKDSRFFDDFSKMFSGAAGTFTDVKREVEGMAMDKMEKIMARMHLVRRDEFEVVRLMVEQARAKQEELEKKLADLEKLLDLKQSNQDASSMQL